VNDRGQYGKPACSRYSMSRVGVALYHSVGDKAAAIQQLAIDWTALYQNLASQVGEITFDPGSPSGYHITTQKEWSDNPPDAKKVEWWKSYAKPVFDLWVKFKHEQLGDDSRMSDYIAFAERWQTNWDVYEGWKKRLEALRAEAQKRGFMISAPLPTELQTTVWADVAAGAGGVWGIAKYAVWAVLGIGALVVLRR
jgi:hypothetical protein